MFTIYVIDIGNDLSRQPLIIFFLIELVLLNVTLNVETKHVGNIVKDENASQNA